MRDFIKYYILAVLFFSAILFSGCAGLKEFTRGIMGISTKDVELSRPEARVKVFNYDYQAAYDLTLKILQHLGSPVYCNDREKNMVAFYVSEADTTVAGVFLKKIDDKNTQVEVASPSTFAKEYMAVRLFAYFDDPKKLDEKPEIPKDVKIIKK